MEKSFVFFLGVTYGKRIIFGVSNIWHRMIFQQIMLERILFSAFLNVPVFYLSTDIVDFLRCTLFSGRCFPLKRLNRIHCQQNIIRLQ